MRIENHVIASCRTVAVDRPARPEEPQIGGTASQMPGANPHEGEENEQPDVERDGGGR